TADSIVSNNASGIESIVIGGGIINYAKDKDSVSEIKGSDIYSNEATGDLSLIGGGGIYNINIGNGKTYIGDNNKIIRANYTESILSLISGGGLYNINESEGGNGIIDGNSGDISI